MRFEKFLIHGGILFLTAVFVLTGGYAGIAHAGSPTGLDGYVWLDADNEPLPFQDDATIQEMMRSANVLGREKVGRGVAGVEKLVLEHEGLQFHAAFRSVDVSVRVPPASGVRKTTMKYRDAAIFESAAYVLSELLGIGRVPPVVERSVDGQSGTVQIWMEETLPEVELIQQKILRPPDVVRWRQQKQIMYAFDNLIANSDRNQGNLLIDQSWNIWFIDHTRAFKRSSKLLNRDGITACDRQLWRSLREIDDETLRHHLEPYLESQEIARLLSRRIKLIQHIQKLIDKHGEEAVIFDLRSPGAETADWNG
jgi:hypothetical protein